MRCKVGDRAICIRGEHEGKVCEIIAAGPTYTETSTRTPLPGWLVSFPAPVNWGQPNGWDNLTEGWYPDAWLKPIRDPGDDAKDETLSWLPVPSTEKEAA